MAKYIFEVIEAAKSAKTKAEKIKILRSNESWALKDVLRGTLDKAIKWDLPEGTPPYTPNDGHNSPSNLLKQNKQFKYFVYGTVSKQLPKYKRESIFIALLESIHPKDAELVVSMINKEKFGGGITANLVNEAFPDLVKSI